MNLNKEKRRYCVSVRMNSDEMKRMNEQRGRIRRGTYLRQIFNGSLPAMVPEVNHKTYSELARSASNLNQIAHHLNMDGQVDMQKTLDALRDFRLKLMQASI